MKQQDKELLLKDLCSRFPYGVKYIRDSWNYESDQEMSVVETLDYIDKDGYISPTKVYTVEDIKPCLFPLSSMTEEQKKELNEIIDLEVEIAISHIKSGIPNLVTGIKRLNWLLKNHFDIYDLIPMGLANDATNLNIY